MLTIQKSFDKNAFSNIIKFDYEVDWNSINKGFSAELNSEIYEFDIISKTNFIPINGQKTKSIYYKIIATMTENGCVFFVAKFADGVKNTAIKSSFIATANYSGKIYLLNKDEEIISAKKYFNGTFVGNIMVSDYKVNSFMAMDCSTIAVVHYTNYYVEVGGYYYYHSTYTGTTYETICTGGGGDSGGVGGGTTGGGSDGTDQYEDVFIKEQNPCDQVKKVGRNEKTLELMNILKTKTSSTKEYGYLLVNNNSTISETPIEGKDGEKGIDFYINWKIDGLVHSHYTGLLSVFSVADIFSIAELFKNGRIKDVNTFTIGVVTASGTQYLMAIDDPIAFSSFAMNLFEGDIISEMELCLYEKQYDKLFKISSTNSSTTNETNFVKYLEKNNTGLKILKGTTDMKNWSELKTDANGIVIPIPCS